MTEELPPTPPRGTPEGHTKEKPAPTELGEPGSPGHGMTPYVPHAADARAVEAEAKHVDAHADEHAHDADAHADDAHAHEEPRLGPIDWPAWGYAAVGIAAGVILLLALWVAIS